MAFFASASGGRHFKADAITWRDLTLQWDGAGFMTCAEWEAGLNPGTAAIGGGRGTEGWEQGSYRS